MSESENGDLPAPHGNDSPGSLDPSCGEKCPGRRSHVATYARLAELARYARAAVAAGRDATLLIAWGGCTQPPDAEVLLYDEGGQPGFVCSADSPVAASVGRAALLTVTTELPADTGRGPGDRATIVLSGRLSYPEIAQPPLPGVVTLTLSLDQVVLEHHQREAAPIVQTIPLELYRGIEPDSFHDHALALIEHTNQCHQDDLRQRVADLAGSDIDHVAGATLERVTPDGAQLIWVGVDGAYPLDLRFPHRASDLTSMSRLLRDQLTGPPRTEL